MSNCSVKLIVFNCHLVAECTSILFKQIFVLYIILCHIVKNILSHFLILCRNNKRYFWRPVAALNLDQQLYNSLMSGGGQKGLRLQGLPLQVNKEDFLFTLVRYYCWDSYWDYVVSWIYIKLTATKDRLVEFTHFKAILQKFSYFLKQICALVLMVSYICYVA